MGTKNRNFGPEDYFPQIPYRQPRGNNGGGPQAPAAKQSLETWLKVFEEDYPQIKANKELVFVGHSLGPLFILHLLEKYPLKLKCAIFVSPFLTSPGGKWQIDVVNRSFYKSNFDFGRLLKLVLVSEVLYGSDDPHVPLFRAKEFAGKMQSRLVTVPGGKHLNDENSGEPVLEALKLII